MARRRWSSPVQQSGFRIQSARKPYLSALAQEDERALNAGELQRRWSQGGEDFLRSLRRRSSCRAAAKQPIQTAPSRDLPAGCFSSISGKSLT